MSTSPLKELQSQLINKLKANQLAASPYYNDQWTVPRDQSVEDAKKLNHTFRVFYLQRYIAESEIRKLITHVPYICTAGDSFIQTQDLEVQSSLEEARRNFPDLIANEDRRLSRSKCIASIAKCYAIGGYKSPVQPLPPSSIFPCIVISGAGPQFEAPYLDYADFIFTASSHQSRLPRYSHFGPVPSTWPELLSAARSGKQDFIEIGSSRGTHVFHKAGYLVSMAECMHLWLSAFNDMVPLLSKGAKQKLGYFKLSAIGCGFFSDVAGADTNIGTTLMPLLVRATEAALGAHAYPHIGRVEFCDFSKEGAFKPTGRDFARNPQLSTVHGPRSDVLDFSPEAKEEFVVGLLNPSDCFACVGNETRYLSVESMIGDNTTIRATQCYLWNEEVLDEGKYVAVEGIAEEGGRL